DISAYATDEARTDFALLASESYEEYAGKVLETPTLQLSLERGSGRQLLVDSLFLSFDERTGQQHVSYVLVWASSTGGGGGIHLEHPRDLGDDLPHEQGTVRLCLERGSMHGFLDCDYGAVRAEPDGGFTPFLSTGNTGMAAIDAEASRATLEDGGTRTWIADPSAYWEPPPPQVFDPRRFQVPVRGTFVTGEGADCEVTYKDAWVVALLEESGGVCVGGQNPDTVVGLKEELPWTTPTTPGEYPFDGIVDFGIDNCLQQNQDIRLQIWVFAGGTCNVGGTPVNFYCPAKKEVTQMDYKRVCLAEGTQVLAADGSPVRVEQVKVGDKLLSSASGRVLTVTTVSRGGEGKPLVKLKDEAGQEVMMTETHPVVTVARGVVQAGEVAPGDEVLTRSGPRKLVAVERVPHEGMVYNVALGTEEELARAGGPEARTLFANGFLVGDSYLQSELEKARRTDTREVLARLHQRWHRDFRLHRAKQNRR
ncbi:MAG TPA: Hint domain-containing protein, partial [Myxococcaceae bacterium]|nr:Hint domain-containing protein [Myxococcaceae bacterium]